MMLLTNVGYIVQHSVGKYIPYKSPNLLKLDPLGLCSKVQVPPAIGFKV
jgi:hypothetical protein